jgi:hypothetical protein
MSMNRWLKWILIVAAFAFGQHLAANGGSIKLW